MNNMNNNNMMMNNMSNNNMMMNNMNNNNMMMNNMNNNNMMMNNMNNNNLMMNNMNNINMMNNNYNMTKKKFNQTLYLDNEKFIIVVKETKSKIILECIPDDEFTSLFDYSIDLSLENFYNLGKSFKQCDNLDEIYNLIQNIMLQQNLPQINLNTPVNNSNNLNMNVAPTPSSNLMSPSVKLESMNNDSFALLFKIPLFSGKYEDIRIEFLKNEKNIYKQYEKLKNKYFKIKSIALGYNNNTNMGMNQFDNLVNNINPFGINSISNDSTKLSQIIQEINNKNNNF